MTLPNSGVIPRAEGLSSSRAKSLVERKSEMVAAGRAREMGVWRANLQHPLWPGLGLVLERVRPPERPATEAKRVPKRLRHLFWNTAESQLDVDRAGAYIARRLLRTMDLQGLAWGAQALRREDWERAAAARGLEPKVRRLARNLADCLITYTPRRSPPTKPAVIAGPTAGLQDLMAMKIKVMAERGEMRDYFDVKAIDEEGAISVEEGVELYMRRYGIDPSSDALPHLYRTMGDLSDVEADDLLPIDLAELQRWWSARQVRVLRNSDRFG